MKSSILFIFFLLLFLLCITQKLYSVCKYYMNQMTALLLKMFLFWFEVAYKLQQQSYSHKTFPQYTKVIVTTLLWLLFTYSRHGTNNQATPTLLSMCVTSSDEVYLKTIKSSRKRYCVLYISLVDICSVIAHSEVSTHALQVVMSLL